MNESFDIWRLLAGLGIFLFGVHLLEDSVKALSGRTFRRMISPYTRGRLRAIGSGVFVTGVVQSSSAVSLMVLAFVGAGVLSMENAIAVMLGSNIGTTFAAWVVAFFGFKMSIASFAFPFLAGAGIALAFARPGSRPFNLCRFLIGFGFLFLGLDYMKVSVEGFSRGFDPAAIGGYGLWFYLLAGVVLTALMQASSATIAVALTALNSQLITFEMGAAMVIGANVGTTITVLLGSIGRGVRAKKIVGISHLIFNLVTGVIAFAGIGLLIRLVGVLIDTTTNSVMGLALFHSLFNILGVLIFFPFIGLLGRSLLRIYPHRKTILTVYLDRTPVEVTDAAKAALTKEIDHLFEECRLYNLRVLEIGARQVFDGDLPFEKYGGRKLSLDDLYTAIKLLHAEIFAYYARLQAQKLEAGEVNHLERLVFASRNIMNSVKNFKGIRADFEEFDGAANSYLNKQYSRFRERLLELYRDINSLRALDSEAERYRRLLKLFIHIEKEDKKFIAETMTAVAGNRIREMEIASLLLVNRLFTQSCRLQVFGLKDLLLSPEQIDDFDRALDLKEMIDEEQDREGGGGGDGETAGG
ncbi:MAG: Na/Pi symporter [Desulfurivibrionaceae bacterium]|nr:Na/Pi symporter [Desulfurivibrionaceae bacterium]